MIYRRLLTGDWAEIDELAEEILGAGDDEPGEEHYLHLRLVHLAVLRGQLAAATDHLVDSTDFGSPATSNSSRSARPPTPPSPWPATRPRWPTTWRWRCWTSGAAGGLHEAVRTAWPSRSTRRSSSSASTLSRTCWRPSSVARPGSSPRFCARSYAASRAARCRPQPHETVEEDLTAAVSAYEELGYPYLRARAQADLGAWLLARERRDEALAPLQSASVTFARLGAAPAGNRVHRLLAEEGPRVTSSDRAEAATAAYPVIVNLIRPPRTSVPGPKALTTNESATAASR